MYFGNPTAGGRIQPHLENWDGTSVRITRTAGPCGHAGNPHEHPNVQGEALDMGDGKCTRPVIAAAAGVILPRTAAMVMQGIVHIQHAEGFRTDYSHMAPVLVKPGQTVALGQQIGEIGDARDVSVFPTMACHLHYNVLHNGVQQDPWPYINQTPPAPPATGGDMLQGTNPKQLNNKTTTILGDSTRFRAQPGIGTTPVLATYGAGTTFTPDWEVTGAAVNGNTVWYGGWGKTDKGYEFGYFHSSVVGPLTDFAAGGITPEKLAAEKAASERTGYNAGRGAVQAAAAGVPPK